MIEDPRQELLIALAGDVCWLDYQATMVDAMVANALHDLCEHCGSDEELAFLEHQLIATIEAERRESARGDGWR